MTLKSKTRYEKSKLIVLTAQHFILMKVIMKNLWRLS